MRTILLVCGDIDSFADLASALARYGDVDLFWAESGGEALDMISEAAVDLVVTDERLVDMTGLEFSGRLISVNPMINCAVVSSLSLEDFHEASEGLGVLAQLPIRPGAEEAEDLLRRLKNMKDLIHSMVPPPVQQVG